jgi:hypothetical protein
MSYFIQNDFEDLILFVTKKPLLSFLFVQLHIHCSKTKIKGLIWWKIND